jgi:SAM-dependent methyltransferase
MKPALSRYALSQVPQTWQAFSQGEVLAHQLENQFNLWWPRIFGYHLLKVGTLSCQLDTSACGIRHQIHLAASGDNVSVIADPDDLPFIEHAVDAVLLAHCLEYTQDPHHVIREAHRVLMPDGYLLLSGFNPYSPMGLLKLWPGLHRRLPWSGRFFSQSRVRDWLQLLGFELLYEQRLFCASMLTASAANSAFRLWAEQHLNYFGAAYVLVARKRTLPLTPIKPKWQLTNNFKPAVKGVSAREQGGIPS